MESRVMHTETETESNDLPEWKVQELQSWQRLVDREQERDLKIRESVRKESV